MAGLVLADEDDVVVPPKPVRDLGDKPEPDALRMSEDDIGRILTERPAVPVTETGVRGKPHKPVLAPEGVAINNRRCKLVPDKGGEWMIVKFLDEGGRGGMQRRALPSAFLEKMENVLQANPQATFIVSGESLNYESVEYILLQKVLIEQAPASQPSHVVTVPPTPASAPVTTTSAPSSAPARYTPPGRSRTVSRADSLVSEMLGSQRKPVLTEVQQPKTQDIPSVAPVAARELLADENKLVADRLVRVVPETGTHWYLACFESDNTLQEPPYRLLPCKLLEEAAKADDGDPQKFTPNDLTPGLRHIVRVKEKNVAPPPTARYRVSGEVLQYKGRKYLLLRKHMPERDMGQF